MNEFVEQHFLRSPIGGSAQSLATKTKPLVFADSRSKNLLNFIERISPSDAPILIGGDTGTGKELIARHIHRLSGRKGPFLVVNCGAINDELADSELFGHEAGSFTGALRQREGWFEAANGGTLFMDEICDLSSSLQVKLLRVLQEKEIVRVGSRDAIPVDVRLVAATNVDIDLAVAAGNFRRDLFYRINIAQLKLPRLCDRSADIIPLAEHFLKYYSKKMKIRKPKFSKDTIDLLLSYSWPGNIRELENVIHFALLVSDQEIITPQHLKIKADIKPAQLKPVWKNTYNKHQINIHNAKTGRAGNDEDQKSDAVIAGDPISIIKFQLTRLFKANRGSENFDLLESIIIHQAFSHSRSNQVHCSALLGISRNVTRRLLKSHGLLASSKEMEKSESSDISNDLSKNHFKEAIPIKNFSNNYLSSSDYSSQI
jgi:DNA-binding NtrC family response regulator